MASLSKPLEYPLFNAGVESMNAVGTGLPSVRRRGPAPWQWLAIASVCVLGGFYLANSLYIPKVEGGVQVHLHLGKTHDSELAQVAAPNFTDIAIRAPGDLAVHDKRFSLNPFALFTSTGTATVRVCAVSSD
jgi:hypothetical protein